MGVVGLEQIQATLLSLPNEILLQIFEDLHEELCHLAKLSRKLNYLAIPEYLTRYGTKLPLSSNDLVLTGDQFTSVLPALNVALFIRDAQSISCTIRSPDGQALQEIRRLNIFLSNLDYIGAAHLDFGDHTNYWTKAVNGLNWTEWTREVGFLLQSCAAKGCKSLSIRNGESQAMAMLSGCSYAREEAKVERRSAGAHEDILSIPSKRSRTMTCSIETLVIQSCMIFCSDFSEWATHLINSSPIQTLILDTPWLEDPGALLPAFSVPTLRSLSIHCKVEYGTLLSFLARHPRALTELSIDSELYADVLPPYTHESLLQLIKTSILVNLSTLRATPEYLTCLLNVSDALPQLQSTTIFLHVPCNQRFSFSQINRSLSTVAARLGQTRLSMKLFVECEHVHWVDFGQNNASGAELNLQNLITSLELNIPCSVLYFLAWPLRPDIVALPHCVASFPKLQHFTLVDWPYGLEDTTAFVHLLAERCNTIRSVIVNGNSVSVKGGDN